MDGEKKKRKMEDEEDDEEQKIEWFFALVKSTREVHEKLTKGEHKGIQKANEDKPPPPPPVVWNPCFRPEDFMEDVVQLKVAGCGSSTSNTVIPRTSWCDRGEKEEKYLMEELEPPPVSVSVSVAAVGTRKREDEESEDVDKGGDTGLDLNLSL